MTDKLHVQILNINTNRITRMSSSPIAYKYASSYHDTAIPRKDVRRVAQPIRVSVNFHKCILDSVLLPLHCMSRTQTISEFAKSRFQGSEMPERLRESLTSQTNPPDTVTRQFTGRIFERGNPATAEVPQVCK